MWKYLFYLKSLVNRKKNTLHLDQNFVLMGPLAQSIHPIIFHTHLWRVFGADLYLVIDLEKNKNKIPVHHKVRQQQF